MKPKTYRSVLLMTLLRERHFSLNIKPPNRGNLLLHHLYMYYTSKSSQSSNYASQATRISRATFSAGHLSKERVVIMRTHVRPGHPLKSEKVLTQIKRSRETLSSDTF